MSKTLTAFYAATYNLTDPDTTFAASATVVPTGYATPAVYGAAGTAWTVTNAGQLLSGGTPTGFGVDLVGGGQVNNLSGGIVQAYRAVVLGAPGTVVNAGLIRSQNYYNAVLFGVGGSLTNAATGTIASAGISAGAAVLFGGAGTVVNAGTITGATGTAVGMAAGFANRVAVVAGAVFGGTVNGGNTLGSSVQSTLELTSGASVGTLSGLGTQFVNFAQVTVDSGARWAIADAIGAGATIVDSGTLAPVTLGAGALVTVANDGTILAPGGGRYAAVSLVGNGTLVNYGNVYAPSFYSVYATGGGTIINASGAVMAKRLASKSLIPSSPGVGVTLINAGQLPDVYFRTDGNSVTNTASGTIRGASGIGMVLGTNLGTGYLRNAGLIAGSFVALSDGGATVGSGTTVTNQSSGTIGGTGVLYGIRFAGNGTVVDAGTIGGTSVGISIAGAAAVTIQAGGTVSGSQFAILLSNTVNSTSRLAIDPNAIVSGKAKGGRISTLELMSGTSDGTLTGLGTTFLNFATTTIDNGAVWTIADGGQMARNQRLTNSGSLAIAGTFSAYGLITAGSNGIQFVSGSASRLILHALVQVSGTVDGGGGTLELATSYYPGKLYALATGQLTNFASVTVDSGVSWKFNGAIPNTAPVTVAGTLLNGVALAAGSQLTIGATGAVQNAYGAGISGAGTVWNAGSISGTGYGIQFSAGDANRLLLAAGGTIAGTVNGGNTIGATAVSTLELTSGASTGTLSGLGSRYLNFGQIALDAGANWVLGGTNTIAAGVTLTETNATLTATGTLVNNGGIVLDPSTMVVGDLLGTGSIAIQAGSTLEVTGTIGANETIVFAGPNGYLHLDNPTAMLGRVVGFDITDRIDLKGVDPGSVSYTAGQLNFSGGSSFPLATPSNNPLQNAASADGANVTALCFLPGSLIATPSGETPVEELKTGDIVLNATGQPRRVAWLGIGQVLATANRRTAATPVIVRKSALAPNVPHRDLRVTKGHAFYLDGVLIPVEFLINQRSIVWDTRAQEVQVYHVELETHDVLLANGAPAESYRDDGNRWLFRNANEGWDQPTKRTFAPVQTGGPVVDRVWRRLLDRAGGPPHQRLTYDPDLHLRVNGKRVNPTSHTEDWAVFRLDRTDREVRIVSRAAAPRDLGLARDPRMLGVAVRRIALRANGATHSVDADSVRMADGFHGYERADKLRWTDGDARVPPSLFDGATGPAELLLWLGGRTPYPEPARRRVSR